MKLILSILVLLGATAAHAAPERKLECDYVVVQSDVENRHPLKVESEDEGARLLFYKTKDIQVLVGQYAGDEDYVSRSITTKQQSIHGHTFMNKRGDIPRLTVFAMKPHIRDRAYLDCALKLQTQPTN